MKYAFAVLLLLAAGLRTDAADSPRFDAATLK
jgi:hypothetical protein